MSEMINVPDGWELKLSSELCNKIADGTHDTPKPSFFGFKLITSKNLKDNRLDFEDCYLISKEDYTNINKRSQVNQYDILFGMIGTIGNPVIVLDKKIQFSIKNVGLFKFNGNYELSKWFYYYLTSENFNQYLDFILSGSSQKFVSLGMLRTLPILIPKDKKEQKKIAKILSTLDTAIESTQKLIDKEKNIKKGLMSDLLQNGIDKNGKIRTPQTHKYKDSKLGLIPEEWEFVSLRKIGNVITGNTPSTDIEEYYNGNIPFIGPIDFTGQKYILNTEKTVTFEGLNNSREIPKNSILTVCIGSTIGKIALSITKCCTNQQVNTLICNKEYFHEFIYYLMKHFLLKQLNIEAGLQAVPIVNKSSFEKLILPCSLDLEEQKQIAKILNIQDKKIEKEEENLAKLKELKKGLMSDLLSGKVRVKV